MLAGTQAYRARALENHPDKLRTRLEREATEAEVAEAERLFNEVQEAHDTLERLYNARSEAS